MSALLLLLDHRDIPHVIAQTHAGVSSSAFSELSRVVTRSLTCLFAEVGTSHSGMCLCCVRVSVCRFLNAFVLLWYISISAELIGTEALGWQCVNLVRIAMSKLV